MTDFVIFGISVALSFAAWGAICYRYVWPFIRSRSLPDAAAPLLYVNVFRFVGASFLVPGVAGSLPRAFAVAGAFGDEPDRTRYLLVPAGPVRGASRASSPGSLRNFEVFPEDS